MSDPRTDAATSRRNRGVLVILFGVVAGMVGLSYAAVPLYDLFCRVTGFGGTTQVADDVGTEVLDRTVRVRFVGATDAGLPWAFGPETREVELPIGEPALVYYWAENRSDEPVAGTAVYNVTPQKTGLYFNKVECFCFTAQTLQPGERAEFPVYFFVDPAMADDASQDDVQAITLSYTFFRSESDELDDATDDFYREAEETVSALSADLAAQPAGDVRVE